MRTVTFRATLASLLLLVSLGTRGDAAIPRDTVGSPYRMRSGALVAEHRIAGLRVVEILAGGATRFDERLPIVLAIHGRGDRVRLPAADLERLAVPVRVLMPEAPAPFGEGFTWSPVSVTEGRDSELADALAENAGRLAQVLEWALRARPRVGEPVVTGFSQGGMLAYALARHHPELVGEAVPVAAFLPGPLVPGEAAGLAPIHAVNGVDDSIVRIAAARTSVRALRGLGFSVTLVEIEGAGHVPTASLKRAVDDALRSAISRATVRASRTDARRRSPGRAR